MATPVYDAFLPSLDNVQSSLAHQVAPLLLPALNNCSMVHDKQVVVNGCIASYLSNGEKHLICPKLWLVYTSYSAVRD